MKKVCSYQNRLYICTQKLKQKQMTTTIFKSEKKAKVYEIRSAKAQGVYAAGELIRVVKTDDINQLIECNENNQFYNFTATEIKVA